MKKMDIRHEFIEIKLICAIGLILQTCPPTMPGSRYIF